MFAITVAITIVMQVKIGPATIEQRSLEWLQGSSLVAGVREISSGAVKASAQAFRWASGSIDAGVNRAFHNEAQPGRRALGLTFDRSPAFKKAEGEKSRVAEDEAEGDSPAGSGPVQAAAEADADDGE
jgi:hypothetical protein